MIVAVTVIVTVLKTAIVVFRDRCYIVTVFVVINVVGTMWL